jgi:hypothetical protein
MIQHSKQFSTFRYIFITILISVLLYDSLRQNKRVIILI